MVRSFNILGRLRNIGTLTNPTYPPSQPGCQAQSGAIMSANQGVAGSIPGPATFFR